MAPKHAATEYSQLFSMIMINYQKYWSYHMRLVTSLTTCVLVLAISACADNVKKNEPGAKPAPVATTSPTPSVQAPAPAMTPATPAPTSIPGSTLTPEQKMAAFIVNTSKSQNIPEAEIREILSHAQYRQSIIDAITRPAEAKPWKNYRPIFMTDARINGGRNFLAQHRDALKRVEQNTGVPAEVIVAIIGVETSYGQNKGSSNVLDALYTLAFYYPKREVFFSGELANLIALSKEEKLDIYQLKGSYAGAMGWGQFMPSSYRNYAKDGSADGRRDLFNNLDDVFSSVANYFVVHGWRKGEPVFARARADANALAFVPGTPEAKFSLAEIAQKGYRPVDAVPALPATLVTLEGDQGTEHWIGFQNFYAITRYNRSPLYAMAVFQLSQAIAEPVATP
jgi:membrane-bound lytic murein transglycosylase B